MPMTVEMTVMADAGAETDGQAVARAIQDLREDVLLPDRWCRSDANWMAPCRAVRSYPVERTVRAAARKERDQQDHCRRPTMPTRAQRRVENITPTQSGRRRRRVAGLSVAGNGRDRDTDWDWPVPR